MMETKSDFFTPKSLESLMDAMNSVDLLLETINDTTRVVDEVEGLFKPQDLYLAAEHIKRYKFLLGQVLNSHVYYNSDRGKLVRAGRDANGQQVLHPNKIRKISVGDTAQVERKMSDVPKLQDFEILKLLGVGSFGIVKLCFNKRNGRYYCFKILSKKKTYRKKHVHHVLNEKDILLSIDHPNIVKLYCTFNDEHYLYLILEFVQGGDLFLHLKNHNLTEENVKFYALQIIDALAYLHARKIAYRDLKPENLLLSSTGHLKIADFGFSKRIDLKSFTWCGTPEYIAPEVINGDGHDHRIDYWSLGILIFEMISGFTPFSAPSIFQLLSVITKPDVLIYPEEMSQEAVDLIRKLLVVNPDDRLGSDSMGGINEILNHEWFNGVTLDDIKSGKISPPIMPIIKSPSDTSHFLPDESGLDKEVDNLLDIPIPPEVTIILSNF